MMPTAGFLVTVSHPAEVGLTVGSQQASDVKTRCFIRCGPAADVFVDWCVRHGWAVSVTRVETPISLSKVEQWRVSSLIKQFMSEV